MKTVMKEEIQSRDKFASTTLGRDELEQAISFVLKQIDRKLEAFTHAFPGPTTTSLQYEAGDNVHWTTGFWTGQLWLAYEVTGEERYRAAAEIHTESFDRRIRERIDIETHDLGFLYTLSCVSAYKLTGSLKAKEAALEAADRLMDRYLPQAGIIQAWGNLSDPNQRGRFIIDCLNNLPLLYWASEVSGERRYAEAAERHLEQTASHIVREDSSTYHTYYMNPETGEPLYGKTSGGYADDSCWARGQAWGICGFPLNYAYVRDEQYLKLGKKLIHYFWNRLPGDLIPYWDLSLSGQEVPKDSSAAAIAACGMLQLADALPETDADKGIYEKMAVAIVGSLIRSYSAASEPECDGLLLHAVYSVPQGMGVDECNLWGDYYYFEALVRLSKDWKMYW
jgi:unsaturated chondroitin disaccharide hydrolase